MDTTEKQKVEGHVTVTIPAAVNDVAKVEQMPYGSQEDCHSIPLVEDSAHRDGSMHSQQSLPHDHDHHYKLLVGKSHPLYAEVGNAVKVVGIKTTKEAYDYFAETGYKKQFMPIWKTIWLGVLAGFYIGIGYALASVVGGQLDEETSHGVFNLVFGAIGLPVGLTMVVLMGAELFTSNTTYLTIGVLEGRVGVYGLLKSWLVSWFANLAGALLLVWMLDAGEVFTKGNADAANFIVYKASAKTHLGWGVAVIRGVLCNWLVNMAVFQSVLAQDLTGKFVGIWLPISTFMMLGFEHSIANQFFLFMGVTLQSQVCVPDNTKFLKYCNFNVGRVVASNLIPVTIGNIIGGAVFVAFAISLGYGRPAKVVNDWYQRLVGPARDKMIGSGAYTWPLKKAAQPDTPRTTTAMKLLNGKASTVAGLHAH